MSCQKIVLVVLLWPLIVSQKHAHSILTNSLLAAFLRLPARCRPVCCCSSLWPTYSRREILTHEWEWSLFMDSTLISTPDLPCRQQVVTSNTGPILVFPRIQPLGSDQLSSLGKAYSDKPLNLWIVKILQCLSPWNTVRLQLWSGILHQYKICALCLVVITFQFVHYIFAMDPFFWHDETRKSQYKNSASGWRQKRKRTESISEQNCFSEMRHVKEHFLWAMVGQDPSYSPSRSTSAGVCWGKTK